MSIAQLTASHRVPGPTFAQVHAELQQLARDRARFDPELVRKGNLTQGQARDRMEIVRAMMADIDRICSRAGTCTEQHSFPWAARRRELQQELHARRRTFAQRIRAGDMDQATADRRNLALQAMLAVYEEGWDWPPNPKDPRRPLDQFRDVTAAIEANHPEAQKALAI